jgi:conjugal transfer pilus assembly protein TraB
MKNLLSKLTVKQRQRATIGAAVAVIIVIGFLIVQMTDSSKKPVKPATNKKKASLLTEKVEKDIWMAAEEQNIRALEKSNEDMKAQIEQGKAEIKNEVQAELQKFRTDLMAGGQTPKTGKGMPPVPPPSFKNGQDALPGGSVPPSGPTLNNQGVPATKASFPQTGPKGFAERSGSFIRVFEEDVKATKEAEKSNKKPSEKEQTTWLPAGSFMKAVLINGLDAPTSMGSQAEPYPVVKSVTDLSILPNRFKMNLTECFIVGAGYGNLSDERVYIRTERLSCVKQNGQVIETPLAGHVVGEDGKLGMRGRYVSKQGQQIAMALFAGTLGGFGEALKPQQSVALNLNPNGQTGVVRPDLNQVLESGAYGGVGSSLNKIADHYLKMADKMVPVIELDAGRKPEVMVLKGQKLEILGKN